jgi:hypothetical protein
MLHNHQMREYEVTLRSGVWYLLAPDSESAAWSALELSRERNDQLLNVKQTDEWCLHPYVVSFVYVILRPTRSRSMST